MKFRRVRQTLVFVLALMATAPAIAADAPIAKGDVLRVTISDPKRPDSRTEHTVTVDASGAIALPLIGKVAVAGLTGSAAEGKITKNYRDKNLLGVVAVRRSPPSK